MTRPITVIIVTKNEAPVMARCLDALSAFDDTFNDIIVVDSNSTDDTAAIAAAHGARVINFEWNGAYPKKRQWCLDTLDIKHDFVFFVDADEVVTPALIAELKTLEYTAAGYFIRGRYVVDGRVLNHGLVNNKLCLINREKIEFPVIDDLDSAAMEEIEGHYQPVLKRVYRDSPLGQVRASLLHYTDIHGASWAARHMRYAAWQALVDRRGALPTENHRGRAALKAVFKALPYKPLTAFVHSYVLKRGFLDGRAGFAFARSRWRYYQMVDRYFK